MRNFARLFLRFFAIAFGFFAGCMTAGIAYVFLTGIIRPDDFGRISADEITFTLIIGTLGIAAVFGRAVLLPALVLIIVFELTRRRDWLTYALAGLLLGSVLWIAAPATAEAGATGALSWMAARAAVCGGLGALAYWFVTGRYAGLWLPSERPEAAAAGAGEGGPAT